MSKGQKSQAKKAKGQTGQTKGNFFTGADLKLNREIKAERAKGAEQKQSGFIQQLNEQRTTAPAFAEAKKELDSERLFRGEQIVKRPEPKQAGTELKINTDPSQAEKPEPNKGFSGQIDWNYKNRGNNG